MSGPRPSADQVSRPRVHADQGRASAAPAVVGYLGGSITAGAGASDPATRSWRALTTLWLQARQPERTWREVNAAVGGTGSDLGAFRCGQELLPHDPELVFVEFAVNDGSTPRETVERAMEGIVRQLRRHKPAMRLVFVFTATRDMLLAYARGESSETVLLHRRIARYYGIPCVDVGRALGERTKGEAETTAAFLPDGVHPSDAGHRVYADCLQAFLDGWLEASSKGVVAESDGNADALPLPPPLRPDPLEGWLCDAWSAEAAGWERDASSLRGKYPHMLTAHRPGAELTLRFRGTAIGVYWLVAPDSGDIEWSVDEGQFVTVSAWDRYATTMTRAHYRILCAELENRGHTLLLRVSAGKAPASTGHWIRIGAFLIGRSGRGQ